MDAFCLWMQTYLISGLDAQKNVKKKKKKVVIIFAGGYSTFYL